MGLMVIWIWYLPPPLLDQAALGDGPDPQVLDEFGHLQIQIELLATKPIHAN